MTKKEFGECVEKAVEECKKAYNKSRSIAEGMYTNAVRENKEAVGLYFLEGNPEYMFNKYMEKLSLSKLDRLYSLLKDATRTRITSMASEEVEKYREDRLKEISEDINRKMLKFESLTDEMARIVVKDAIDELILEQKRLKTLGVDEIKATLIDKMGISRTISVAAPMAKDEAKVLANISRDRETLTKFFELLDQYKRLQSDVKTIGIERVIIARDLIPSNMNFSLSDIDEDKLFSEGTFDKIQGQISSYIQKAIDEESLEKNNFSKEAKDYYLCLKSTGYKYSNELPHDEKALKHFESMMPNRLYELAKLQNQEWERLHNKVFKTNEITARIVTLSSEIEETKESISQSIVESYKKHYLDNDVYSSISTRVNGKLEYAVGKEALSDFFTTGTWPTDEQIETFKKARELNRSEAEKCVIRVEVAKQKFSGLQEKTLTAKSDDIERLKKEMTDLVGNWENPTILGIINNAMPISREIDREVANINSIPNSIFKSELEFNENN